MFVANSGSSGEKRLWSRGRREGIAGYLPATISGEAPVASIRLIPEKTSLFEPFPEFHYCKSIPFSAVDKHIGGEHQGEDNLLALIISYHFCDEHFSTAFAPYEPGKEVHGFFLHPQSGICVPVLQDHTCFL
ncbi:hypothetical protein METP1_02821 [Methanosarcinales archaeon]|nr:hypothetical protein METP1_02821 [Methanosarcinales archaeon]